jgi:ABC-2 type transport system permease protein
MSGGQEPNRDRRSGSASPAWWLVCKRDLQELWLGGKAPVLLLIFSVLLGIMTYVLASNSELSLMPPREMVYETLKAAISVGLFISLIIGAESISGERARSTLEGLLLTPASRRQIVVGKFLAGVSPWPLVLAITIPHLWVISQGTDVLSQAVSWGALLGSILAPAFTAMGMLASFWSNTNRNSFSVGLGLYILLLLLSQLPGSAQTGAMGLLLQWVNPIAATNHFLAKHLVNNGTLDELGIWLTSPVVFALLVFVLLFGYASPSLHLAGGKAGRFWSYLGRLVGASMLASLLLPLGAPSAMALEPKKATSVEKQPALLAQPLEVSIDANYNVVKAGDHILFNTTVTNKASEASAPLTVAMNIINLDSASDVVDPEDWSPQRTQYIGPLAAGASSKLAWRVNAILDGDYMVYMVVIPEPASRESTSHPVASSGIHLTVTPFTKLNPRSVLPYSIGGPAVLVLGMFFLNRYRRRKVDAGASP